MFTGEDFLPSEVTDQFPEEEKYDEGGPMVCFPGDFVTELSVNNPNVTPEDQIENTLEASTPPPSVDGDPVNELSCLPSGPLGEKSACYVPTPGPSNLPHALVSVAIPSPLGGDHHLAELSGMPKGQSEGAAQEFNSPVPATSNCATAAHASSSFNHQYVSPADIIPFPKVSQRRKRTGKGLKSTILTSTPNKNFLMEKKQKGESLADEKEKRRAARLNKQKEKAEKNMKKVKVLKAKGRK